MYGGEIYSLTYHQSNLDQPARSVHEEEGIEDGMSVVCPPEPREEVSTAHDSEDVDDGSVYGEQHSCEPCNGLPAPVVELGQDVGAVIRIKMDIGDLIVSDLMALSRANTCTLGQIIICCTYGMIVWSVGLVLLTASTSNHIFRDGWNVAEVSRTNPTWHMVILGLHFFFFFYVNFSPNLFRSSFSFSLRIPVTHLLKKSLKRHKRSEAVWVEMW